MANHAIVRLDVMTGTRVEADLKSAKFYDGEEPAVIDNAQLVVLGEKIDRECYKCTAPTEDSVRADIYLVATPELFYDECKKHYLTEWENEADKPVRLYSLHPVADTFSATEEAFDGVPAVDKFVGFAADSTKIAVQDDKDDKTIGKIVYKETVGYGKGAYTFFMIDVL